MNNKFIIISTISFLLISFVFLSIVESKMADINNHDVWMVYFENPQSQVLDFKIENHSKKSNDFHWRIISDKTIVNEGDAEVQLGQTKKIPVALSEIDIRDKQVIISVSDGNNIKEIYKNL